jgi:predicted Mrr-cat superfamily restriction endonuclease
VTTPTCWLIRAGEESRHARTFVDRKVVTLGWPDIDGLHDLTGMSREEIKTALRAADHIKRSEQDAAELLTFRDDVAIGDIVITPDAKTREALVGVVTGEYEYRDPSPTGDYHHVRDMTWYRRVHRDDLDPVLVKELNWRRTIRELGNQEQWLAIAAAAQAGTGGRPPSARGNAKLAPRAGAKVDPADRPTRLCPGCGYSKPLMQFVPGNDSCVDCR